MIVFNFRWSFLENIQGSVRLDAGQKDCDLGGPIFFWFGRSYILAASKNRQIKIHVAEFGITTAI